MDGASYITGGFNMEILALTVPNGAIIDDSFIHMSSQVSRTNETDHTPPRVWMNGYFVWDGTVGYNGSRSDEIGDYVRRWGGEASLPYLGAGTLGGSWVLDYGWPGTDFFLWGSCRV
jgi:hypothetical protein